MSLSRARTRPVPIGFIEPCLPSLVEIPPQGPGWLHEIKHDGYRLLAWRKGARVRLFTRNGIDWSEHFPRIIEAVAALQVRACLIDGEAVCVRPDGIADFELLRKRLEPVRMLAFDVLSIDGDDLRGGPIELRKIDTRSAVARRALWDPAQRAHRRRDRGARLCAGLHARRRRHRLEAQGLALPVRSIARLDQAEEPAQRCGVSGSDGGLERRSMAMSDKELRIVADARSMVVVLDAVTQAQAGPGGRQS
jgi:hypothetical protein